MLLGPNLNNCEPSWRIKNAPRSTALEVALRDSVVTSQGVDIVYSLNTADPVPPLPLYNFVPSGFAQSPSPSSETVEVAVKLAVVVSHGVERL